MKHLLIEGWRGINHSIAMTMQYQLIEMLKMDDVSVSFRDLPFNNPAWNEIDNDSGFAPEIKARIKAVPPPAWGWLDCVYSHTPREDRPRPLADKVATFIITEFGLRPLADQKGYIAEICRGDNMVVVPSQWSKAKLLEYGFPEEKLALIPLGVNPDFFYPPTPAERLHIRQQVLATPEHFVFLNVGAKTWNKGIDLLLRAFAKVRKRHSHARLVLKDNKKLYGFGAESIMADLSRNHPDVMDEDVRSSIVLLTSTLSLPQMRLLYGAADAYVSPYRAEGFNLPVIEAIACGTRAIVTAGGPTDDFCDRDTALSVTSEPVDNSSRGIDIPGFHLEPNLDSLIEQMEAALTEAAAADQAALGRKRLLENFSWAQGTRMMVDMF